MSHARRRSLAAGWLAVWLPLGLAACQRPERGALEPLPPLPPGQAQAASPRIDGAVGSTTALPAPEIAIGHTQPITVPVAGTPETGGDISLNFVDTDIREVVAQVLGTILHANYTIAPTIRGTATLRTTTPVTRRQALAALQAVLAENGAALVESSGIYRVVPATLAVNGAPALAQGGALTGSAVIPLRYASAEDLAKVLQPYVGAGGKVVADPAHNVLLVSGDPTSRETLIALIHAFDTDVLAGQSYALFPVNNGNAKEFAAALQSAFRLPANAPPGLVRVVPMERIGSVLLISSQPRYIDEGRRLFAMVQQRLQQNTRSWHVYYLQNSRSNDIAYVLQQAFTPDRVTAQPSRRALGQTGMGYNTQSGGGLGGGGLGGGGNLGGGIGGSTMGGATGGLMDGGAGNVLGTGGSGTTGLAGSLGTQVAGGAANAPSSANPLFGGLEPGSPSGNAGSNAANALRIIPDPQNNALLVYSTPQETDTIEAMLHKVDILPLQVRIDATIAEVTLNKNLQYGTQFYFKSGINGALSFGANATAFTSGFPGFVLSGPNNGTAALNALEAVTTVKVLSSPQILVLDNEPARLQVGNLVPYLTSSAQSTITNGAPIINSIQYRETGVIMQVTPRVNSGGLVTLDISQEVSDVNTAAPATAGINSPTFLERNITSRVVVQDGQTVGLAGLIRDNSSRQNGGIPFLKDVPLLGFLAGAQNNARQRTELLVLITPHVVHDQRDARALTEDLRDKVINAAMVPEDLGHVRPGVSADPQHFIRRTLRP